MPPKVKLFMHDTKKKFKCEDCGCEYFHKGEKEHEYFCADCEAGYLVEEVDVES